MNGAVDFVIAVQQDAFHVSLQTFFKKRIPMILTNYFRYPGFLVLPITYRTECTQDGRELPPMLLSCRRTFDDQKQDSS